MTSVTIPAGVTKIGDGAFSDCQSLTSVTIPVGVTEIGKDVFMGSRPVRVAPHISIAKFDKEDKPGACAGFAKAYLDGAELDGEIKADYLKYIKRQRKRLFPEAVQHEELLRVMLAKKMLARKDIDLLLEECDQQNNIVAKAAVLDYADRNSNVNANLKL
nr:leucine-rich repeat domain-containing protein [Pseudoflavonifractor sp. 60]